MVSAEFPAFRLIGIYMPNLLAKIPYWEALIAALSSESDGPALAIGDFNTCRPYLDEAGAIDPVAHYMGRVEQIGFCDLWRRRYPAGREYSWYSTRGMASASTMPFFRRALLREPARSATHTRSASPASPITRH